MATNWNSNRKSLTRDNHKTFKQHTADEVSIEPLLRHVLRAAMRCEVPTTANIAAEAGISEECCHDVMLIAQQLGLAAYEPDPAL